MARRALILAAVCLAATPAVAGSVAHFTLGLSAEYLGERQDVEDERARRKSLLAAVALAVEGHILDPRFLGFQATLRRDSTDLSQDEEGDATFETLFYDGRVRAFSNRPLSVELHAGRSRHDVEGFAGSAAVAGTSQRRGIGLRFTPAGMLDLRLSHEQTDFSADGAGTLRDEERSLFRLAADFNLPKIDARFDARREDASLFSGLIDQASDTALLDVAVNRGGRTSFQSLLTWNDTAVESAGGEQSTSVAVTQNWLQVRTSRNGHWRVGASSQASDYGEGNLTAVQLYGLVVEPLTPSFQVDAQVSFLRTDDNALGVRDEPSVSAGLRWGLTRGPWDVTVYPRVTYSRRTGDTIADETAWGGTLSIAARRTWRRASLGLELERVENQRSISGASENPTLPSQSFLAGLERALTRGRFFAERRLLRRSRVRLDATLEERVRELRGLELTDDSARAELTLDLGSFQLRGAAGRIEVTGDELPSRIESTHASAHWFPTAWLALDLLAYEENRQASGFEGRLAYQEAGIRMAYAKLAFFARARVQESSGTDALQREDQRFWIGVSRSFGWTLGTNGNKPRRPPVATGHGPETWW